MNADNIFILSLCVFIALLAFKPSEPYLSEFLICNFKTEQSYCKTIHTSNACTKNLQCQWNNEISSCSIKPCSSFDSNSCTKDINYCILDESNNNQCINDTCYKSFTANQVNNEIYPWSTYSYLIFLVFLTIGPMTNMLSYRLAIVCGVMGRVVTRFLLLYGSSIFQMKIMQVTYSLGTAAEDLFAAYIYTVVPVIYYQKSTSYLKTSAMLSSVIASLLGDILVTQYHASLMTLMMISATFVTVGAIFGTIILKDSTQENTKSSLRQQMKSSSNSSTGLNDSEDDDDDDDTSMSKSTTKKSTTTIKTTTNNNNTIPATTINRFTNIQFLFTCVGDKYIHFINQITLIVSIIMKSRFLTLFLIWWIIGSSVYTLLISYEVSIYSELNGGDKWNGSVLAIMLLSGCFGAMLPVWLKLDLLTTAKPSSSSSSSTAVYKSQLRVKSTQVKNDMINEGLIGKDEYTDTTATTAATAAKEGVDDERTDGSSDDDNNSNHHNNNSNNSSNNSNNNHNHNNSNNNTLESNETRVIIYLTIAGIISTTCVVTFVLFWELYVSIFSLIVFLAAWQFINVVFLAKLATYINEHSDLMLNGNLAITSSSSSAAATAAARRRQGNRSNRKGNSGNNNSNSSNNNGGNNSKSKYKNKSRYEVVSLNPLLPIDTNHNPYDDDDDDDEEKQQPGNNHKKTNNNIISGSSNDYFKNKIRTNNSKHVAGINSISASTIASTDIDDDDDDDDGIQPYSNNNFNINTHHHHHHHHHSTNNNTDSPHSVAVMFVIVLSVFLQVILQVILFSWLNLSLYIVSVVLMMMYCSFTFLYITTASVYLWCK